MTFFNVAGKNEKEASSATTGGLFHLVPPVGSARAGAVRIATPRARQTTLLS